MIKYWPTQQSINLNYAVVNIFITTQKKFVYNLSNNTNHYLYIDILNTVHKKKLFKIILKELKELILDVIELNLNQNQLKKLSYQLLYDFIKKTSKAFLYNISIKKGNHYSCNYEDSFHFVVLNEHNLLIYNLLIYLIFGSSSIDQKLFIFNQLYTPYKHVQILFENFLIQTSNLVIKHLFNKSVSLSKIINFIQNNYIANSSYLSTRSIILFLNNLSWQSFLYKYFEQPKAIYGSRYQVWLISIEGIVTKYIYTYRLQDMKKLSQTRTVFLCCLELKDLLIPKIEKTTIIVCKYLFYIIINLLGNIVILITRAIILYLKK